MSWCSDSLEDEVICLLSGLHANTDVTLSLEVYSLADVPIHIQFPLCLTYPYIRSTCVSDCRCLMCQKRVKIVILSKTSRRYSMRSSTGGKFRLCPGGKFLSLDSGSGSNFVVWKLSRKFLKYNLHWKLQKSARCRWKTYCTVSYRGLYSSKVEKWQN